MILVDNRKDEGKKLFPEIKRLNIPCESMLLPFGDVCFEGKTPDGTVMVGFERKTIEDILNCIDDSRISGHQIIGMKQFFAERFIVVEGMWKPRSDGALMEGFPNGFWKPFQRRGGRVVQYSKLRRFLFTLEMSGIRVMFTRNLFETAYDIVEWYHWFQKAEHMSLREKKKVIVASLNGKPPLVRRWAEELEGIGVKGAEAAARHFKSGLALATAAEVEWVGAGITGTKTAINIVKEIRG